MPYYNRKQLLINTLFSISKSSMINETEIIIVDDASNYLNRLDDIHLIFPRLNIKLYRFEPYEKYWICPVIPHNKSISIAESDIIIIQNPECYHIGDIILDTYNRIKYNDYIVYACYSLNEDKTDYITKNIMINRLIDNIEFLYTEKSIWYQHSLYNNRCLNFCVSIYKKDFIDLEEFDERYAYGYAYADNDFIDRIRTKKMNILQIDDPFVVHQFHESYNINNEYDINKDLYFIISKGIKGFFLDKNIFVYKDDKIYIKSYKDINNVDVNIYDLNNNHIYYNNMTFISYIEYWIKPSDNSFLDGFIIELIKNNIVILKIKIL